MGKFKTCQAQARLSDWTGSQGKKKKEIDKDVDEWAKEKIFSPFLSNEAVEDSASSSSSNDNGDNRSKVKMMKTKAAAAAAANVEKDVELLNDQLFF